MRAATVGRLLQQQAHKARRDGFTQDAGSRLGMEAEREKGDAHQEARPDSSHQPPACLPAWRGAVLGPEIGI